MTWCWDLFFREMYLFSRDVYTGPNTIVSSSKLLEHSGAQMFFCNFCENIQNTCFKEHPCIPAPKVVSQQLFFFWILLTRLTFTYSTIEALWKVWNMLKVNNKTTRTISFRSLLCFLCWLWTYFTSFSSVSIVEFEQLNN